MLLLGFRYALREPTRLLLTAAGVACAVVLTVFLAGVYLGATRGSLAYIEQADAQVWVGRRGTWNLMRSSGIVPVALGARLERGHLAGVGGARRGCCGGDAPTDQAGRDQQQPSEGSHTASPSGTGAKHGA